MAVYQECVGESGALKNTGAKEQCLEGILIKAVLAVPGFTFASITAAKTKATWDAAIAAKNIFPLYDVEELTSANTEDTFFEGRTKQYRTASGKKVSTFTSMLGLCSHSALKSFHNKEMQMFEFTEDGAIKGVNAEDGKIKGQDVVLNIGKRLDATADRPPSTLITVSYKDANQLEDDGAILRPGTWSAADLFGIFDIDLLQVSASSTIIKLTASDGCAGGGENVTSFEDADFVIRDLSGTIVTHTFTEADADGVYTLTGTGFADGYTVELDGVITQTGLSFETPEPLVLVVT